MSEWISVSNRKPSKRSVLGASSMTGFCGEVTFFKGEFYEANDADWIPVTKEITHWMPLPEPPNKS